jgi:hypothetical protein
MTTPGGGMSLASTRKRRLLREWSEMGLFNAMSFLGSLASAPARVRYGVVVFRPGQEPALNDAVGGLSLVPLERPDPDVRPEALHDARRPAVHDDGVP